MRLFVSVRPSAAALEHLAARIAQVRAAAPPDGSLRWQDPARWHLTLAFLGEVPDERATHLSDRLDRVAARHARVGPLCLSGSGAFDHRLLWVGVGQAGAEPGTDAAVAALRRLAVAVQHGMRHEGVPQPGRTWRPHLTVGRERGRGGAEGGSVSAAVAALSDYAGPPWWVDEVLLVRSLLGPSPRHDTISVARLQGPARPDGPA